MGEENRPLRSRVGVAILGAILVGSIAAAGGAASVMHPAILSLLSIGGAVQSTRSATFAASDTTVTAEVTETPEPSPTATPTRVPIATPNLIGSTISGTVVSTNPATSRFVMSRNGTRYTILVDQATTFSGIATQLSDLRPRYHVSVTIAAQSGAAYLARSVVVSVDN